MRLRWIVVLCALGLKLSLMGALLLLGRGVIEKNYAALEREHVESDLAHLSLLLQAQINELDVTALDYAAWDITYSYMHQRRVDYSAVNLGAASFSAREISLFLLLNESGRVVLEKSFENAPHDILNADIAQLIRAVKRRSQTNANVAGLITLTRGPAIVAMRPVLPTRGNSPSRGTLIMVRNLGDKQLAELSRLIDLAVTISGTPGEASETRGTSQLQLTRNRLAILGADRVLGSAMVNDIWRRPGICLQIEHSRSIWRQGQQVFRAFLLVSIVVGLLFAFLSVWLIQRYVVRRVEQLMQLVRDAQGKNGLNARVRMHGSDEIAHLGRHMNQLLENLQNSQEKVLAVQERLRFEATHDSLTGIWNRGATLRLLDAELDRAEREGKPTAVIMFDVDHFKRINDHFGHSVGDTALQSIAAAITRNLRSFDICCRYGGEEFLVIAPNCDITQGARLAQRILDFCSSTPVILHDQAFCVTLSAGVTAASNRSPGEDFIIVADRALYRAKENGRNRVEAEEMVADRPVRGARFASPISRIM